MTKDNKSSYAFIGFFITIFSTLFLPAEVLNNSISLGFPVRFFKIYPSSYAAIQKGNTILSAICIDLVALALDVIIYSYIIHLINKFIVARLKQN